jgi:hypothetical protein
MIRRTLLVIVVVLTAGWSPVRVAAQTREVMSDQQILIKIEHDWDEAFRGRNPGFIETILAEEFIATYSDGTQGDKAHELSLAAGFDRAIESSTLDDFLVKIYGDTAVVWMSQHVVGISKGQQTALTFRYVDVFVQRGGRWQCVSSQSTKVA